MAKRASASPGPYTPTRGPFKGQTFPSYRQYQNAQAQAKGFSSHAARLRAPVAARSVQALLTLRPRVQVSRQRTLDVVALARRTGMPIRQAAKAEGVGLARVVKYAAGAIEKVGGRYVAKATDTLARTVQVLTPSGYRAVTISGRNASKRAAEAARYAHAVERYLNTGDASRLQAFRGRQLRTATKQGFPYITDTDVLDELARASELSFETLYQVAA